MVWENLQGGLYFITLILAFLTAVFGLVLIHNLFKDKLKELFSDLNFFIFFFLITGYVLFALGELTWYLVFKVFERIESASMADLYWSVGAVFMLIAFTVFSLRMYKQYGEPNKLLFLVILGALVLGLVLYYTSSIGLTEAKSQGDIFLGYFYPVISSLILITSLNVLLFLPRIELFGTNLLFLFFANIGFLLGDLLYVYTTVQGGYGLVNALSDFLYVGAYFLSSLSFFTMLLKIHGPRVSPPS